MSHSDLSTEAQNVPEIAGLPAESTPWVCLGTYIQVTLWYLLAMSICWALGIEGIYGSPLPFYALLYPANSTIAVPLIAIAFAGLVYVALRRVFHHGANVGGWVIAPIAICMAALTVVYGKESSLPWTSDPWAQVYWHGPPLFFFVVAAVAFVELTRRFDWFKGQYSRRFVTWFLIAVVAFAILFSAAIAGIRGGPDGISQAYARHGYEYSGDIGTTGSIKALFRDYAKYRPHLSMHAKVHPPGPIALLWLISYVSTQDPFPLSIATIFLGAMGVIPLYLLARDMCNQRIALTASMLYVLMPSIVLFTATSADILFLPFATGSLWLFLRALHRPSIPAALAAGAVFALASLLTYSLLTLGAVFAAIAFLRMSSSRGAFMRVVQTGVLTLSAFLAVHLVIWWWSGFNYIDCFHACKAQFDADQANLDLLTPRFPSWAWKFLNPTAWFYFAGIPVSLLFIRRLIKPDPATKLLFHAFAAATFVVAMLYLGRGEGERSAMYLMPLLVIPAAHMMDEAARRARSITPILTVAAFLAAQCWFTETFFYTFW